MNEKKLKPTVTTDSEQFTQTPTPHVPAGIEASPISATVEAQVENRQAKPVPVRKTSDAVKESRLKPVSGPALQMLLGTLLGDGSMDWNAKHGRFRINHGATQQDYCESKATLLKDYINSPPRIVPNGGWGKDNCYFATVCTPALDFLGTLCYRQDVRYPHDPKRLVRYVNSEWLKQLTWEGIAWWYQDDGCLARSSGICRVAIFNTHKFPRDQVEMLAQMLTERDIKANACPTRKETKIFWTIRLTAASTRLFVKLIASFVHPSLRYKIDAPDRDLPNCAFCGATVDTNYINRARPCCRNPHCKRIRNRERNRRWENKRGRREIFNARAAACRKARLAGQQTSSPFVGSATNACTPTKAGFI